MAYCFARTWESGTAVAAVGTPNRGYELQRQAQGQAQGQAIRLRRRAKFGLSTRPLQIAGRWFSGSTAERTPLCNSELRAPAERDAQTRKGKYHREPLQISTYHSFFFFSFFPFSTASRACWPRAVIKRNVQSMACYMVLVSGGTPHGEEGSRGRKKETGGLSGGFVFNFFFLLEARA